jgi:peptidoglycan/LPS O-acetylase OafA/YrhL
MACALLARKRGHADRLAVGEPVLASAARRQLRVRLANVALGRDNNFNLLRMLAAWVVLIGHSFALSVGTREAEAWLGDLGKLAGVAVDFFFVASGYLVTASLAARQSARAYLRARFLRIFPGLWVMLLLTVFAIGACLTTLPLSSYFASERVYWYLLKGATLITGVSYDLPGVFERNPYPRTVNGSLWTLPYEIRMYVLLLTLWAALRRAMGGRPQFFRLTIVALALAAGASLLSRHFLLPAEGHFARLFYMFFAGASLFVGRDAVILHRGLFWAMLALLLVAAVVHKDAAFVIYTLTLPYVALYLAFRPAGFIRRYNEAGDYSYGTYIYAFPIQQSIAALVPGISVLSLLLLSGAGTLFLAVLSWHFLEKPCLRLIESGDSRCDMGSRRPSLL